MPSSLSLDLEINADSRYKFNRKKIRQGVLSVLAEQGIKQPVVISLSVVGERKIRELEKKYFGEDKVTDVFYSGAQHDEHQPCHLVVTDQDRLNIGIEKYGAPSRFYCPAEVYELMQDSKTGKKEIRFHASNCVHCKTCDIKEPFGSIVWKPPYGGDGPEYENM